MISILRRLLKRKPLYEYGTYNNGRPGRRNRKTGAVQFILWRAGEQGHAEDYWHDTDSFWWPTFIPNDAEVTP